MKSVEHISGVLKHKIRTGQSSSKGQSKPQRTSANLEVMRSGSFKRWQPDSARENFPLPDSQTRL